MDDHGRTPRYESRKSIEEAVKALGIDRSRFYEYSKTGYQKVINEFYYAFTDHEKHPKVNLDYCWLHFRKDLKTIDIISENVGRGNMLGTIMEKRFFDSGEKLFLILDDGWVYEGYPDEMIRVLCDADIPANDFYIVSERFDRFVSYCEDGECLVFTEK